MAAALDKWALFDHPLINWQPNMGQLKIAENNARHKVVSAGRRAGKSYMGGVDKLLPEVFYTRPLANQLRMDGRKRIFWVVGPNFSDSEKEFRVIWNYLRRLEIPMDKPGSYNSPESGDMQITLWDGTFQIIAKSAQNPERLVGEGLSGVILSEAAKLKASIWPKYVRPTLADFGGWSFSSSTPEGKNWFYNLWRQGQDPNNPSWKSWRMPSWVNHYVYTESGRLAVRQGRQIDLKDIPPHEFTRDEDVMKLLEAHRHSNDSIYKLAKDLELQIDSEIMASMAEQTPEAFLQEIYADFTEFVGRVFKEFDEEIHVTDLTFNPGWETYACADYGYNNPNVWLLLQIGPWGEINVLDEIYESGLDPEDFAWEIRDRGLNPNSLRFFYPDPADPLSTKILEKKLGLQAKGGTGGELLNRINLIRKALREPRVVTPDPKFQIEDLAVGTYRPRLMFDRKCAKTIQDFLNYKYPEKKLDALETSTARMEKPLKKDDHGPEALGRFMAGFFGSLAKQGGPRSRVHQATFRSDGISKTFVPQDNSYIPTKGIAAHEKKREVFPKVNDPMADFLSGAYD